MIAARLEAMAAELRDVVIDLGTHPPLACRVAEAADERGQAILESLLDYATEIAPERGA